MTRGEVRTGDAWKSFDTWATWIVPIVLAIPALFMWMSGYGKGATGCCTAPTPPAAVIAPPAPVVTPPAPVVADTSAAPKIDCNSIVSGVTVPFAVNKAVLTAAGKRALDQVVTCLGTGTYEVAGHTDADGDEASNQRLSEARAKAAVAYLISQKVPADRLKAAGFGETTPVADNTTPEGKAKNRRIAFKPL
jgi:OmpA-OmpF porin, OOP family